MLKIENFEVVGWEHAIRGMRNPMNSWDKSDSLFCNAYRACTDCPQYEQNPCAGMLNNSIHVGPNDHTLMMNLAKGGPVHAKYRRMIAVYLDVTAPLYWWKEFDTYKVGTVRNSCSTMHKIHSKEFTMDDFSHEHLFVLGENADFDDVPRFAGEPWDAKLLLDINIRALNYYREKFLKAKRADLIKNYWWQMIQLLPSSYNQRATLMLNYEVLVGIYRDRKNHKLDCWRTFCSWIEELPYSELITGGYDEEESE